MVVDMAGSALALGGSTAAFVTGALRPQIAVKAGVYGVAAAGIIRGRNEYQLWVHQGKMKHDQFYYAQWQGMDESNRHDTIFGKFGGLERQLKYFGAVSIFMAGGCVLGGGCGWACRRGAQRIPFDVLKHMF